MYVYKIWCLVCRNIFHLFDLFLQRSDRPARQEVEEMNLDRRGWEPLVQQWEEEGSSIRRTRELTASSLGAVLQQWRTSSPAHSHHLYIIYGQHPFNDLAPRLSFQKKGGWTASVAMTTFIEALARISGSPPWVMAVVDTSFLLHRH